MLSHFPGRRGEFPRPRVEEVKERGSAGLDLQPPVGPNGHFVSGRPEKTPHVFQLVHESQKIAGKLLLIHKEVLFFLIK